MDESIVSRAPVMFAVLRSRLSVNFIHRVSYPFMFTSVKLHYSYYVFLIQFFVVVENNGR